MRKAIRLNKKTLAHIIEVTGRSDFINTLYENSKATHSYGYVVINTRKPNDVQWLASRHFYREYDFVYPEKDGEFTRVKKAV